MKLILIIFLSVSLNLMSQVTWESEHSFYNYSGVKYTENHAYSLNPVYGKLGEFELKVFSKNFKEQQSIIINNRLPLKLNNLIAVGTSDVLLLIDGKTLTMLVINEDGTEATKKLIEDKKANFYDPIIKTKSANSFYLGRTIKPKKLGFVIQCYDLKLSNLWSYENVPEKGRQELLQMDGNDKGLRLLTQFRKSSMSNNGVMDITGLDSEGKQMFNKTMPENKRMYESYQLSFLDSKMNYYLINTFGKSNSKNLPDIPESVTYDLIDAKGENLNSYILNTSDLENRILPYTNERSFFNEKPSVSPLEILEVDNKIKLICSTNYFWKHPTTSPGGTTTAASTSTLASTADFYDLDLILFDLDGGFKNFKKISKPYKHFEIKNGTTINYGSTLSEILKAKGTGYQMMNNGQLILKGYNRNFHYVNSISLNGGKEPIESRIYFGKVVDPTQGVKNVTRLQAEKTAFGPLEKLYYQSVIPSKNGYRILNYNEITRMLQVSSVLN